MRGSGQRPTKVRRAGAIPTAMREAPSQRRCPPPPAKVPTSKETGCETKWPSPVPWLKSRALGSGHRRAALPPRSNQPGRDRGSWGSSGPRSPDEQPAPRMWHSPRPRRPSSRQTGLCPSGRWRHRRAPSCRAGPRPLTWVALGAHRWQRLLPSAVHSGSEFPRKQQLQRAPRSRGHMQVQRREGPAPSTASHGPGGRRGRVSSALRRGPVRGPKGRVSQGGARAAAAHPPPSQHPGTPFPLPPRDR